MSEPSIEQQPSTEEPPGLILGDDPAAQMAQILDFLAPEPDATTAGEGEAQDGAPAAQPGQQPAPAEGADGAGGDAQPPAGGDGSQPGVPGDGGAPAAGTGEPTAQPVDGGAGTGAVDAATLNDTWGEIATSFEEAQTKHLQEEALSAVREEHARYFEAVEKHPRRLVGETVPDLKKGAGTVVLRDAEDAREWQEAAKQLLWEEVQSRASARAEELSGVFSTVHQSISLFRDNPDLIPGTKQFDRELADQFAQLAKDYEVRSGDKLVGYAVPVQPMINQLRSQIAARRAAAKTAQPSAQPAPQAQQPAPSPAQRRAAEQPRDAQGRWDGPQAGVPSKAGATSAGSDEATLLYEAFARQNGFSI